MNFYLCQISLCLFYSYAISGYGPFNSYGKNETTFFFFKSDSKCKMRQLLHLYLCQISFFPFNSWTKSDYSPFNSWALDYSSFKSGRSGSLRWRTAGSPSSAPSSRSWRRTRWRYKHRFKYENRIYVSYFVFYSSKVLEGYSLILFIRRKRMKV